MRGEGGGRTPRAISGSSDAQAMSAGVSRATIPTMAGMVASLSGLILANQIEQTAKRITAQLADDLEIGAPDA